MGKEESPGADPLRRMSSVPGYRVLGPTWRRQLSKLDQGGWLRPGDQARSWMDGPRGVEGLPQRGRDQVERTAYCRHSSARQRQRDHGDRGYLHEGCASDRDCQKQPDPSYERHLRGTHFGHDID